MNGHEEDMEDGVRKPSSHELPLCHEAMEVQEESTQKNSSPSHSLSLKKDMSLG